MDQGATVYRSYFTILNNIQTCFNSPRILRIFPRSLPRLITLSTLWSKYKCPKVLLFPVFDALYLTFRSYSR